MISTGVIISLVVGAVVGLIGASIPILASKDVDASTGGNLIVRGLVAIGVSSIFLTVAILVVFAFFEDYLETFSAASLIVFIVVFSVYGAERAHKFNRKRK